MSDNGKAFQIAGFVLGITSLVCIFLNTVVALILSILGIIFSKIGKDSAITSNSSASFGSAGLILSITSACISIVKLVFAVLFYIGVLSFLSASSSYAIL